MNNSAILKKCVDELKKDKPRMDYIVGILETLLDMQGGNLSVVSTHPLFPDKLNPPIVDEGRLLDAMAKASLEQVKANSQIG